MNRLILFLFIALALNSSGCKSKELQSEEINKIGKEINPSQEKPEGKVIHLIQEQLQSSLIQMVKVQRKALDTKVEVLGTIASDTDQVIQVRPETAGTLEKYMVSIGDMVEMGQLLARYKTESHSNEIKELKANHKGVIVGLYVEMGDHLDPSVPVITIADTSRLRCVLDVYEKDIGKIKKGQEVKVKVSAFPNKIFSGRVNYVSPRVDENSRTVKVRVDIENPRSELKFGMFVAAQIKIGIQHAVMIPDSAVQEVEGKSITFVAKGNQAFVPRSVTLGERSNGFVEIISGLREGETIISKGGFILKSEIGESN